jgi:hypothetical protein
MTKRARPGQGRVRRPGRTPRPAAGAEPQEFEPPPAPRQHPPGAGPELSGGDVDADWQRGESSGEETAGGSVATPDQDLVDEIGRALGVEQASEGEVTTSEEILRRRDRLRWHLERDADVREREEDDRRDAEEA